MSKKRSKYINVRDFMQDEYPWTFIVGARSVGKDELSTNKLMTDKGLKEIGKLEIGDKVLNSKGEFTDLIGIYPQGEKELCRVWFNNSTYVDCSKTHLWTVYSRKDYKYNLTTRELMTKYENATRGQRVYVKKPVVKFEEKTLPLHPYIIGAFLGDGCCKQPQLTISSEDFWVPNKIAQLLNAKGYKSSKYSYDWFFISGRVKKGRGVHTLIKSDILPNELKTGALDKRVPKEYLTSSVEQRLQLLQGLLDTDGACQTNGSVTFYTNSKGLAEDVKFLVESLGGESNLRQYERKNKKNIEYVVSVRLDNEFHMKLFTLPRKKERLSPRRSKPSRLFIKKVEKLNKRGQTVCIEVNEPDHLYLTKNFIPTHNTISSFTEAIKTFKKTGKRSIYMRRFDTEIERTAIDLSLIGSLTNTEVAREKVKINGVNTDVITVDGEPAIYMIALSVAGKFKSNAFPNIDLIMMDEFIDMNGRELKDETNKFLQFAMTVFRDMNNFKALFVANATNLFNCYFLDLEMLPTAKITRNKELGVKIVMYETSEELKQEQLSTKLARIVEHVEGDNGSSLTNTFKGNFDTFIRKLEKNDKYLGTYKLNDTLYGAYKHGKDVLISPKADSNFKFKCALSYGDVDEEFGLVTWERYQTLRQLFFRQHVFFTDIRTRTIFMKRFKTPSLME